MDFGVDLFWSVPAALLAVVVGLGLQIVAYARTTRPVKPVVRRFLTALRLMTVSLLLFALWRPATETERILERKGKLALLVDSSRSMSIGDEVLGEKRAAVTRLRRAAHIFADNKVLWRQITDVSDVRAWAFADSLEPLPVGAERLASATSLGIEPAGEATALGEALRKAASSVPPPQSILVISDGLSNSGIDPLDVVASGGPLVYAISVGRREPGESTRDIAAAGIFAPSSAFKESEVTILGRFSLTGLAGRRVTVALLADGQKVASKEITVYTSEAMAEASFTWKAAKSGPVRLEVRAQALPDEILVVNNSAATYIDVKEGGLKILYVEGNFRWEAKFLRMALAVSKDVDVRFVVPRGEQWQGAEEALAADWDVLVLGNLPAEVLSMAARASIRKAVSDGGRGLLFLGGPKGLGLGGYGQTTLARLCPFEFSASEVFDECLWKVEPVMAGPHAAVVDLGDAKAMSWEKLPALLALNTVGSARPGASVLLVGKPKKRDEVTGALSQCPKREDAALLALQEYGSGRTAAFTGEGTWQWAMGSTIKLPAERELAATSHGRFWRQLFSWLAKRQPRGEISVDLTLTSHSVSRGGTVEMAAGVFDDSLEPLSDVTLVAEISRGEKKSMHTFWVEGKRYRLDFEPSETGDYSVRVEARRGSEVLAEARSAFVATAADVELQTLVSRPGLLAAMALATGGRYAPADKADYVLSEIAASGKSSRYVQLQRSEIWSSYAYLALVLGLLTLEWGARKLAGLV